MTSLLERRGDTIALSAGLFLVLVIVVAYVVGITATAQDLEKALNPDQATAVPPVYDLEGASKLDLKGFTPGS